VEAALYESGLVKDPADLYVLDMERLPNLTVGNGNLGIKRAQAILAEIEKKKNLTLAEFIGSLGIRFLGKRAAEEFIKKCGKKTLREWREMTTEESLALGSGIGPVVVAGLAACSGLVDKLLANGVVVGDADDAAEETPAATSGGKLANLVMVFTGALPSGMKRAAAQQLVLENGGAVKDEVGPTVTHLVQADPSSQSSKTRKAAKYGTKVISEEQFLEMIKLSSAAEYT
jgi:DNA ligase (NAD+)